MPAPAAARGSLCGAHARAPAPHPRGPRPRSSPLPTQPPAPPHPAQPARPCHPAHSVAYWGARVGPDGGALHDFRIQAWPDTGRDSNGKRYNVYCAAGAKNHITPTNLKGQAGLDHPCCSRAAAGAPRELRVTLKPGACSAAEGLSQISVLLNGSPVPPGVVTRKFAAAGSVVAVSLPAWPGGAAPEARAEFTLSFPPGHACAADPCPTGGCRLVFFWLEAGSLARTWPRGAH